MSDAEFDAAAGELYRRNLPGFDRQGLTKIAAGASLARFHTLVVERPDRQ